MNVLDRARRAGCLACVVATLAIFFAVGALVSLVGGDLLTTVQSLVVAALLAGATLWLARRRLSE